MVGNEGESVLYTFPKRERLSSKKLIRELFTKGSSFYLYPFKVIYLPVDKVSERDSVHRVLFTVPKRNFKKAVVRNLIRRRMREAYRLNKHVLYSSPSFSPTLIAFVYIGKEKATFAEISPKLKACIARLKKDSCL